MGLVTHDGRLDLRSGKPVIHGLNVKHSFISLEERSLRKYSNTFYQALHISKKAFHYSQLCQVKLSTT